MTQTRKPKKKRPSGKDYFSTYGDLSFQVPLSVGTLNAALLQT